MKPVEERDPIDVHVGTRLRAARAGVRMTLEELGRHLGLTYQQIQKYETGANRISASTLYRIARIFEVTPDWFYSGLLEEDESSRPLVVGRAEIASSIMLSRIENLDVRQTLNRLIKALASGSQDAPDKAEAQQDRSHDVVDGALKNGAAGPM